MNLNDAIISRSMHGICELDVEKAVKYFTEKCFISQYNGKFTLVRVRNKKAVALKVEISQDDAVELINRVGLTAIKSEVFRDAVTYRMV